MNSSKNKIDQHHLLVKQSGITPWMCRLFLTALAFVPLLSMAQSEIIIYPNRSGVVNMKTDPRYLLRTGDANQASYNITKIQQAINDCQGKNEGAEGDAGPEVSQVLYFPKGTYYVDNKMALSDIDGIAREVTFQGYHRDSTVIRLTDNNPTFADPSGEVPVISFYEGGFGNNNMGNYAKNFTLDIGSGNPGAVGIKFFDNNYGGMSDITIRSSDPSKVGAIGLKMTNDGGGIGYINNIKIDGFNYGIKSAGFIMAYVFENIQLSQQKIAGILTVDKAIQIRNLTSKNTNNVPVLINSSTTADYHLGHAVIIDSDLQYTGGGTATKAAIENQHGFLFARNIKSNYPKIITDSLGTDRTSNLNSLGEYSSHAPYTLFGATPTPLHSINMPVKEAPEVDIPWETDTLKWAVVNPRENGGADASDAINAALNNPNVSTVCVAYGTINISKPIIFPANHTIKRFLVLGQIKVTGNVLLNSGGGTTPVFTIGTGIHPTLVIEGIKTTNAKAYQYFLNNSTKTVVLRHNSLYGSNRVYRNGAGAGTLFIEDLATLAESTPTYGTQQLGTAFLFKNQEVYARSFNPENMQTYAENDGGKLWVLGFKTEGTGTAYRTRNGGFTEVLGGVINSPFGGETFEMINNELSNVSIIASERKSTTGGTSRERLVIDKQNSSLKDTLVRGDMPIVQLIIVNAQGQKVVKVSPSSVIPLYVRYNGTNVDSLYTFSPISYFGDSRNYAALNSSRWDVIKDGIAGSVYRLTANTPNSNTNLLGERSIIQNKSYSNFKIALDAKTAEPAGNTTADYAIIFGYTGPQDYCYMGINRSTTPNYTQLYSVVNGVRTLRGTSSVQGITSTGYQSWTLERTSGGVIVVKRGLTTILQTGAIAALNIVGKVGVGSYDNKAFFDNINVTGTLINPIAAVQNDDALSIYPEQKIATVNEPVLYPNPANANAFIDMVSTTGKGEIRVQVIGLQGQIFINKIFTAAAGMNHLELNTTGLSAGVYVVRITDTAQTIIKKLIVTK